MFNNLRRPENTQVTLDFVVERVDSGKTIFDGAPWKNQL